jgi:general secretion pathway protein K
MNRVPHGQQGVALIMVLLVVSVATVLAVAMMSKQNLAIHQTSNMLDQSQAYQYALGGEEIARQILHKDLEDEGGIDYQGEDWAQVLEPFEYESGEVEIRITDLQGLFNLNSLSVQGAEGEINRKRFRTLLSSLALDAMILDRIVDWIDKNQATEQLGAEDYEYLVMEPPYRTSSNLLVDTSELRLLLDLSEEDYQLLFPTVCVLPDPGASINVNTAPLNVMRILAPGLSEEKSAELLEFRDYEEGFDDLDEFVRQAGITGEGGINPHGLAVSTQYFQIQVRARYNERVSNLTSVVQRDPASGTMKVISRDLGRFFQSVNTENDEESDV